MEHNYLKNQSGVFANQDMLEMLKRCRTLHDQAVFEFFTGLAKKCQKAFKKYVSILVDKNKPSYKDGRGLPISR